jgi:hypothetical protein
MRVRRDALHCCAIFLLEAAQECYDGAANFCQPEIEMFSLVKTIVLGLFVLLCLLMLWGIVSKNVSTGKEAEYSYSDLYDKVQNGQVLDAIIQGNDLRGHLKVSPRDEFHTTLPPNYDDLQKAMLAAKVNFSMKPGQSNFLLPLLINVGPFMLFFLVGVPPFWVIFKKAGFRPILSILMMVPLVNVILLYFVAFSEWKPVRCRKSEQADFRCDLAHFLVPWQQSSHSTPERSL